MLVAFMADPPRSPDAAAKEDQRADANASPTNIRRNKHNAAKKRRTKQEHQVLDKINMLMSSATPSVGYPAIRGLTVSYLKKLLEEQKTLLLDLERLTIPVEDDLQLANDELGKDEWKETHLEEVQARQSARAPSIAGGGGAQRHQEDRRNEHETTAQMFDLAPEILRQQCTTSRRLTKLQKLEIVLRKIADTKDIINILRRKLRNVQFSNDTPAPGSNASFANAPSQLQHHSGLGTAVQWNTQLSGQNRYLTAAPRLNAYSFNSFRKAVQHGAVTAFGPTAAQSIDHIHSATPTHAGDHNPHQVEPMSTVALSNTSGTSPRLTTSTFDQLPIGTADDDLTHFRSLDTGGLNHVAVGDLGYLRPVTGSTSFRGAPTTQVAQSDPESHAHQLFRSFIISTITPDDACPTTAQLLESGQCTLAVSDIDVEYLVWNDDQEAAPIDDLWGDTSTEELMDALRYVEHSRPELVGGNPLYVIEQFRADRDAFFKVEYNVVHGTRRDRE